MQADTLFTIKRILTENFEEFADSLIEECDRAYINTEVTRLPIPERRSLISYSVKRYLAILEGKGATELDASIYYPHALDPNTSSAHFGFLNCLENDSFLFRHLVSFVWDKAGKDSDMKEVVMQLLLAYKTYTLKNMTDQLEALQRKADATLAEQISRERDTVTRSIRKNLMIETQQLQAKTRRLLDNLESSSESMRPELVGLLCLESDLVDSVLSVEQNRPSSDFADCSHGEALENNSSIADPNEPYGQRFVALTAREHEIAKLIGQGKNNKTIAEELSISEYTVKNHLRSIYQKLGMSNRSQLAASYAHKQTMQIGIRSHETP